MIVSEVMSPPDCHADPTTQHGTWFLSGRHVCKLGIEGLVSKRLGSTYRSGRHPTGSSSRTLRRLQ